jgi:hypothetical protein
MRHVFRYKNFVNALSCIIKRPCGLMDKAPDFESGDCRFESCQGRILCAACMQNFAVGDTMYSTHKQMV